MFSSRYKFMARYKQDYNEQAVPYESEDSITKKILIFLICLILYLVSTVPVGLFLYSIKTINGLNVFRYTGWHAYMSCLLTEADKIEHSR